MPSKHLIEAHDIRELVYEYAREYDPEHRYDEYEHWRVWEEECPDEYERETRQEYDATYERYYDIYE